MRLEKRTHASGNCTLRGIGLLHPGTETLRVKQMHLSEPYGVASFLM